MSCSVLIAETGRIYTISAELLRGIKVQRDMELIRKVLFAIEAKSDLHYSEINIPGEDDLKVARHLELLFDAGMIDGDKDQLLGTPYDAILVRDLTWEGHDLAAALRNETVWQQIKGKFSASELAALPISVVKAVALAAVERWAKSKLGF